MPAIQIEKIVRQTPHVLITQELNPEIGEETRVQWIKSSDQAFDITPDEASFKLRGVGDDGSIWKAIFRSKTNAPGKINLLQGHWDIDGEPKFVGVHTEMAVRLLQKHIKTIKEGSLSADFEQTQETTEEDPSGNEVKVTWVADGSVEGSKGYEVAYNGKGNDGSEWAAYYDKNSGEFEVTHYWAPSKVQKPVADHIQKMKEKQRQAFERLGEWAKSTLKLLE